jgi:hypothetical protein
LNAEIDDYLQELESTDPAMEKLEAIRETDVEADSLDINQFGTTVQAAHAEPPQVAALDAEPAGRRLCSSSHTQLNTWTC